MSEATENFTSPAPTDIDQEGNPVIERDKLGRFKKQSQKGRKTGRIAGSKNVLTGNVKDILKEKGVPFVNSLFDVAMRDLKEKKTTNAVKLCAAFVLKQMPTFKAILIDDAKGMSALEEFATWTPQQKTTYIISGGTEKPSKAEITDLATVTNEQEEENE